MVYTNVLEGNFHCVHDKVIPNFMKLMNPPSITKYKHLDSLLEDEEKSEVKNTSAIRKNQPIIKDTDG